MVLRRLRLTVVGPLLAGLVLAVVFLAVFFMTSNSGDEIVHRSVTDNGRITHSVLSRSLFDPLYRLDVGALDSQLAGLVEEETVTFAEVRDSAGEVLAGQADGWLPDPDLDDALAEQALTRNEVVEWTQGDHVVLTGPIAVGTEQTGVLEIAYDIEPQEAVLASELRKMLFVMLPLLGAALLMVVLIFRFALRPLRMLETAANCIRRGDLTTAVPTPGLRETAGLGGAMEGMRRELQGLYSELEQRVEDRTRQLSTANQALEKSEEHTRAIIDTASDAYIAMDAGGRITDWNAKAKEIFGWSRDEVIGLNLAETIIPPEHRAAHSEGLQRFLGAGKGPVLNQRIEITALRRDGGEIPVELTVWPIRSGDTWTFNAFIQDISERKQAEQALEESEAKYRGIFENVEDIYFQTDLAGTILEISPSVERFSYTREGLIGTSVLEIYEDPEQRSAFVQALLKEGHVTDYELRLKGGDGRVVDSSASAHISYDEDGAPEHIEGALRDITERRRTEQAVRDSQAHTQAILDNAVDAIISINEHGTVEAFNQAAERIFGYAAAEVAGRNISMLMPAPYHDEHDSYLARYLDSGVRHIMGTGREVEGKRKDGTVFPIELSVAEATSGGERTFTGIIRDITERKTRERELEERASKDPLTGVLNHGAIVDKLRAVISGDGDGVSHAVAVIDVDGLKPVNDTYGHQLGDQMLTAVADALSREGAVVGRYGGDEFVAVLRHTDREAAERYSAAVDGSLANAGLTDPESAAGVPVAASIGIAVYPEDGETLAGLIELADSAMYAAKRQRPTGLAGGREARSLGADHAAEMVGQIVPLLTSPGDLTEKLQLVAHRLSVGAGYDAVDFSFFAPELGIPVAQSAFAGAPREALDDWSDEQRTGGPERYQIRELMERTRRPVILEDIERDERLSDGQRAVLAAGGIRSGLVTPMIWEENLVGSVSVGSKRPGVFGPTDAQFMLTVATQVTAIVRGAALADQLQLSATRLRETHGETVMMLAAAAEAHDRGTGQHLHGVRTVTEALAAKLGYNEADVCELGLAGALHDIGKIRIPDAVLVSSGPLAEEEWDLMKHHSSWGAQFLAERPGFELAAQIARSHHERWDGAGYPDGLAGEEIPEAATIVAIADSFDAITSGRPYRARRTVDEAVREIIVHSGTQFNPKAVAAMERLYKRGALPEPEAEEHAA